MSFVLNLIGLKNCTHKKKKTIKKQVHAGDRARRPMETHPCGKAFLLQMHKWEECEPNDPYTLTAAQHSLAHKVDF